MQIQYISAFIENPVFGSSYIGKILFLIGISRVCFCFSPGFGIQTLKVRLALRQGNLSRFTRVNLCIGGKFLMPSLPAIFIP